MKRLFCIAILVIATINLSHAQFSLKKAVGAGAKVTKAAVLTDEMMVEYVKEYIDWMDANNPLCEGDSPYAVRLNNITKNIKDDSINIKAYRVVDVNAFACADGSIRVCAGLMDIMSDQEILGVIGHEIGHVKNEDSKKAFKTALLTSALRDGISSVGGKTAVLSDSQLGDLGEAMSSSAFSKKQEYAADDYGYNFLKSHNENPWAMAQAFKKLQKMMAEVGADKESAIQQLFSTHPDLDKRVENMEERAIADGIAQPIESEPAESQIDAEPEFAAAE